MSDELIREVDEDVRRDQWLEIWKTYGKYVIALVVGIVLTVGGRAGWRAYKEHTFEKDSVRFEQAVAAAAKAKTSDAAKIYSEAAKDVSSLSAYGTLLEFRAAAETAKAGDAKATRVAYEKVEAGAKDERLKAYAGLMAAMYATAAGDDKGAEQKLTALSVEGEPFAFAAMELLGHLAIKRGDSKAALDFFRQLSGREDTPAAARVRAEEMLASLGHPVNRKVLEADRAAAEGGKK